ncbi:MAG: type II toxin-antitoxin system RelE/ParE family toxin [Desulfobacterales bacterium]
MSSPEPLPLRLSPKARQDFIDILRYTGETWGRDQLSVYRDKIDRAFRTILNNPRIGHRRHDLPSTYLVYLVGSHMVIYRIDNDAIGIVRILHQRMSLPRHLPRPHDSP